jgi:hypothetical protein
LSYEAIAQRYGFTPPEGYRMLEQQGRFDIRRLNRADLRAGEYLWLFDAEWWSLEQIAGFTFPEYCLPGFVPFASTDAGDFWCWSPERAGEQGTPVVFCPHDLNMAQVDAPDFAGWCYRRALAYANGYLEQSEEGEARAWLTHWGARLGDLLRPAWRATIAEVAARPFTTWPERTGETGQGFLPTAEYAAIVTRDLVCPGLDVRFRWMR